MEPLEDDTAAPVTLADYFVIVNATLGTRESPSKKAPNVMTNKLFVVYVLRSMHPQFIDHAYVRVRKRGAGWSAETTGTSASR